MFPSDSNLNFKVSMESEASPVSDDDPFHILILGDWSGRESRTNSEQDELENQLLEIDRDNFDQIFQELNVNLNLYLDNDEQNFVSLQLSELDDFHPDKIFERVPVFSDLRSLRERLSKASTFEKAAVEVRSWFEIQGDKNLSQDQPDVQQSLKTYSSSAQLLEDILSKPKQAISSNIEPNSENTGLNLLVSKLVKPFLIKTDENEQSRLISAVDEAVSVLMREILHHPKFKELESAWRGLYFLIRGAETDSKLKIFLFDITKSEFSSALKFSDGSRKINLFNVLENNKNWALICGNYNFRINVDDFAALIRITKIANSVNAPFLSHLALKTVDNEEFNGTQEIENFILNNETPEAKLWNTIRVIPEAESVGLLIQRLLIRLPYGAKTEPMESFSFEEFSEISSRKDYLWTNPCFAIALLIAQSYSRYGWELKENLYRDIEGLPTFVLDDGGSSKIVPSSEFILTERLCEDALKLGLMPIIDYSDDDKIRLARFQSIALPNKFLKGKWN